MTQESLLKSKDSLAQTAYRNMLIAQVKVGKLTPRKATQLFNRYMEA